MKFDKMAIRRRRYPSTNVEALKGRGMGLWASEEAWVRSRRYPSANVEALAGRRMVEALTEENWICWPAKRPRKEANDEV